MYLVFDTETTGLPKNFHAPVTDLDNWPRLVQIGWVRCDKQGREIEGEEFLIKPEGFTIPAAATKIHKITTQRARARGIPLADALAIFSEMLTQSTVVVSHNMGFDAKVLGAEGIRKNTPLDFFAVRKICTKTASTEFCQLPGYGRYKWPKLSELHEALFGMPGREGHTALADARTCAKCFFELRRLGIVK